MIISQAQIWSYAEGCIALFAACLPAGRVLLARKRRHSREMNGPNRFRLKSSSLGFSKTTNEDCSQVNRDHSLVVFKTTSFDVESTVDLTGYQQELNIGLPRTEQ